MIFGNNKMVAFIALVVLIVTTSLELAVAETYECSVENYGSENHQHCIFRNVRYNKNSSNIIFKAPTTDKQSRIVFEDSEMDHLPKEFLETFGSHLKVLIVSKCKLRTVVITHSLEELHAIDNYISKVIVHQTPQNSSLKEIHLQSNRLKDISNITKSCKNARIIDLSRNQELATDSQFDLSQFNGFNQLEYLLLGDIGAFYLNYKKKAILPALTLLDLSMNNLLPSDLRIEYLQNFEKLETLRLNDNNMAQLEYPFLTELKSLKEVYLEGNAFECEYLKKMIDFLNKNNIETPVARPANHCIMGFRIEHGMCCESTSPLIVAKPITPQPPVPTTTSYPATPNTPVFNEVTTKRTDAGTTIVINEPKSDNGVTKLQINLFFVLTGLVLALIPRD